MGLSSKTRRYTQNMDDDEVKASFDSLSIKAAKAKPSENKKKN